MAATRTDDGSTDSNDELDRIVAEHDSIEGAVRGYSHGMVKLVLDGDLHVTTWRELHAAGWFVAGVRQGGSWVYLKPHKDGEDA